MAYSSAGYHTGVILGYDFGQLILEEERDAFGDDGRLHHVPLLRRGWGAPAKQAFSAKQLTETAAALRALRADSDHPPHWLQRRR